MIQIEYFQGWALLLDYYVYLSKFYDILLSKIYINIHSLARFKISHLLKLGLSDPFVKLSKEIVVIF